MFAHVRQKCDSIIIREKQTKQLLRYGNLLVFATAGQGRLAVALTGYKVIPHKTDLTRATPQAPWPVHIGIELAGCKHMRSRVQRIEGWFDSSCSDSLGKRVPQTFFLKRPVEIWGVLLYDGRKWMRER